MVALSAPGQLGPQILSRTSLASSTLPPELGDQGERMAVGTSTPFSVKPRGSHLSL